MVTSLHSLQKTSDILQVDIKVKRDDLFPFFGGGNKGRKLLLISETISKKGCNAVVTTGGAQSNHARATAILCAAKGWECHLILHGTGDELPSATGNLFISKLSGACIDIVKPDQISDSIKNRVLMLENKGYHPYVLPGGGHTLEGTLAYVAAMEELYGQLDGWIPDFIVLPSGTGTTQAGIVVGTKKLGLHSKVIGISVARKNPRGARVINQSCIEAAKTLNLDINDVEIYFDDRFVGEGYEKASLDIINTIQTVAISDGLLVDPTYTGKAFWGLKENIREGTIPRGSKVLFWHTGGIFNLLASSYFKVK